jgi:transcriptional regulator with XRE-family HTH domain
MRAMEAAREALGLSKAELARRGHVPAETVRRLLTAGQGNPTLDTVLSMLRPLGLGLKLAELADPGEGAPAEPDLVRVWLAHYGAPLYGATAAKAEEEPRAEYVLAEALKLARQDATVARVLPVALYRSRDRLDLAELRRLAGERGEGRALGFFLVLTAELAGDPSLARAARPLRPRRPRQRATQFFPVRSRLERRLAEEKTPPVARRWDFRMNMGLDTFEGMFRKAVG